MLGCRTLKPCWPFVRAMKSLHLLNWVQHIIAVRMVNKSCYFFVILFL